jgi:diaminopimelate decarboxylase
MRAALDGGIRQFNVESEPELDALSEIAASMDATAPSPCASTPMSTRAPTTRSPPAARRTSSASRSRARATSTPAPPRLPGLRVVGIDMHIGSQLTDLAPFEAAYTRMADLTRQLRADGHSIERLDLGGGLGIPYTRSNEAPPLPTDYGAMVKRTLGDLGCEIEIEPGRLIAGNAGMLVAQVIWRKAGEGRDFLILDAAMNDLIRPAMYGAHHDIVPLTEAEPGAPLAPSTSSARSAKAATPSPVSARCRRLRPAIWSPSARPGPMARSWPRNTTRARSSPKCW